MNSAIFKTETRNSNPPLLYIKSKRCLQPIIMHTDQINHTLMVLTQMHEMTDLLSIFPKTWSKDTENPTQKKRSKSLNVMLLSIEKGVGP